MVVVVPPNLHLMVWVNEEDFLFVLMVSVFPIFTVLADSVGTEALAMVGRSIVKDPEGFCICPQGELTPHFQ